MDTEKEIARAKEFGLKAENLVVAKQQITPDERGMLLAGYWALLFDYHKGILVLLENGFHGSAFALMRPVIEGLIRAHICLKGSDEEVVSIREDEYRVNFGTVGKSIDEAYGLDGFFQAFLQRAKRALHSYTHSGALQIGRRFNKHDIVPNYSEGEIAEVIRSATSAIFMVNALATKTFGFEQEWEENNRLFQEYGIR